MRMIILSNSQGEAELFFFFFTPNTLVKTMEGQGKLKSQTVQDYKARKKDVTDAVSDKHLMTVVYKERP